MLENNSLEIVRIVDRLNNGGSAMRAVHLAKQLIVGCSAPTYDD